MKKSLITDVISGLLIFLFVYTAVSKLTEIDTFRAAIKQAPFISDRSVFFSWAVPVTELLVSMLLFLPATRTIGLFGAFILMLTFTVYIGYMVGFSPHLPCSCGGVLKQMSWTQHLFFNIAFTILALVGILLHKKSKTTQKAVFYNLA